MRGGGRPPKNALWFELSAASYLKTEIVSFDTQSLDLRSCLFDVNPPPYVNSITEVGYDKEMDITAENNKERYNISCKFSIDEDKLIGVNSRSLHEVFLEFVPALRAERSLQKKMRFVLFTNMRLSKTFTDLQTQENPEAIARLQSGILRLGKKDNDYGPAFDERKFNTQIIAGLTRQIILLSLRVVELNRLYQKSQAFRAALGEFGRTIIRTPVVGLSLLTILRPEASFFCTSRDHAHCTEVAAEGVFCHVGDLRAILGSLRKKSGELVKTKELVRVIEAPSIGRNWRGNGLQGDKLSHLRLCSILTKLLNDPKVSHLPFHVGAYVIPGSLDIILLDSTSLAAQLKATIDEEVRFHPNRVMPLRNLRLGDDALKEVTKISLRQGIQLEVTSNAIVVDHDDETEATVSQIHC